MSRPKVSALRTTLIGSSLRFETGVAGRLRAAITSATAPIGTLMRKSHRHEATERIAAATVGLPAEHTATTSAMLPTPRPRRDDG